MKWFTAILVMQCRIGNERPKIWDSQVRVIRARNAEQAYKAALKLGKKDRVVYRNSRNERVEWSFVGLGELSELLEPRIQSGTEVYSMLKRGKRPDVLKKSALNVFWFQKNENKTAGEILKTFSLKRAAPK